jgi:putative nucleotidyltransferase with HDIG domain
MTMIGTIHFQYLMNMNLPEDIKVDWIKIHLLYNFPNLPSSSVTRPPGYDPGGQRAVKGQRADGPALRTPHRTRRDVFFRVLFQVSAEGNINGNEKNRFFKKGYIFFWAIQKGIPHLNSRIEIPCRDYPGEGVEKLINRKDIIGLFGPQLEMISDESIREMVVKAWSLGLKRGGWKKIDDLMNMPFTLLTETHGVNFIEHTIAVTEGAIGLAVAQKESYSKMPYDIDMDRLVAGGLLHDVGKLLEIEPDGEGGWRKSRSGKCARHPISGAILASEVGFPEEYVNTIACHAKEGEGRPQVIETVLIHQADFSTFNPLVMKNRDILIE